MFASALLGIRLPGPPGTGQSDSDESLGSFSLPLAILQFIAALLTIAAAFWEYYAGLDDLMKVRAFFVSTRQVCCSPDFIMLITVACRIHHIIMAAVTLIIVATCIIYVAKDS
jgi:hypothetical protein